MESLLPAGLGLLTGLLLGLTGAGGGIVGGPLLMLALHLPLSRAAPIALIAVAIGAGLGTLLGLRQGMVRYRAALLIAAMGLLASPLGIALARSLPDAPLALAFAALLIYQAWRQWRDRVPAGGGQRPCALDPASGRFVWNRPCARALAGAGLLAGFLSGLLGVGGGFVLVPALRRHTPLAINAIGATSLMVLTLVSLGGMAMWAAQGGIEWGTALPFVAGTAAGIALGRTAAPQLPEIGLRRVFAGLCLAVALGLLGKLIYF